MIIFEFIPDLFNFIFRLSLLLPEDDQDDQERNPDADSTVGEVEGRPMVAPELEVQKIDHIIEPETVDQVSYRSPQDQSPRDPGEAAAGKEAAVEDKQNRDRHQGENEEEDILPGENPESGPPVMDQREVEEAVDHYNLPPRGGEEGIGRRPFGNLIGHDNNQ